MERARGDSQSPPRNARSPGEGRSNDSRRTSRSGDPATHSPSRSPDRRTSRSGDPRAPPPSNRRTSRGGEPAQSTAMSRSPSRRTSQTGNTPATRTQSPSRRVSRAGEAGIAETREQPPPPAIRTSKPLSHDGAQQTVKEGYPPAVHANGNAAANDDDVDIWQQAARVNTWHGPHASPKATFGNKTGPTDGVVPMDLEEPEADKTPNYQANPYFGKDVESQAAAPDIKGPTSLLGYKFARQRSINWPGWVLFLFYIGAFTFYLYTRIDKTLNLGKFTFYGIILLVVECTGATTVVIYGINLLYNPVHEAFVDDPRQPGTPKVKLAYHIRVIVACYKEDLDCIKRTIKAAHAAVLPYGCQRTIYLCDDGKDPEKRAWIRGKGSDFVYVSGRKRAKGEMNGKSGNVNNVCSQLYPDRNAIPGNEVLCIFDADQMAKKEFFIKTVPLLDGGDDVAMVLSPQCFHNMDLHTDIFNHSNIHFWEYMQVGYDAIGFISCTGTNFLIRANAFGAVGWSPTYTLTEDFALGMELKKEKFQCRYVQDYIAVGEAPHEVRNCFQQRSRWTKGHFQIMFNPKVCPLFQTKLNLFWRLMYCQGVWSYIVGGVSTPFFIALPIITIWIGVFPIVISRPLALAMTIYGVANYSLLYYVRSFRHFENLWFANVANSLLWWAYWKAAWRAFYTRVFSCCASITFKATAKGKGKLKNSAARDLWFHCVLDFLLILTIGVGIWQLIAGATVLSPLLISVLWAVHAAVPPTLLLYYSLLGHGIFFRLLCKFFMVASFSSAAAAVALMWPIKNYNSKNFSGGQLFANKDIGLLFRYIRKGFDQIG